MIVWSQLHGMPTELWMAAERAVCHDEEDRRNALVGCVILRNDGEKLRITVNCTETLSPDDQAAIARWKHHLMAIVEYCGREIAPPA